MNVSATQGTTSTNNQNGTAKVGDNLGKDSFLQLLMTQMRYQDPLEPAKDTEFISQLAQFNSLEQMQNLNDKFDKTLKWSQMSEASGLIGKQVDATISTGVDTNNDGKPDTSQIKGVVSEVRYVDGEPHLVVGTQEIQLSDVTRIYAPVVSNSTQTGNAQSETATQSSNSSSQTETTQSSQSDSNQTGTSS